MHHLSPTQARRIAVQAQLLTAPRPTDLLQTVSHLGLLQVDMTAAVAPNVDLVLWSRLGSRYSVDELHAAREGGALIELRAMLRPAEDHALYTDDMARWASGEGLTGYDASLRDWLQDNSACRRDILSELQSSAPLSSQQLPDTCVRPWRSTGWTNNKNVTTMLELMEVAGDVAVVGRRGTERLWDLAVRAHPHDDPVPWEQARRRRDEIRLHALGVARARGTKCPGEPNDVGEAGEPAEIEGVRGAWRVDPAYLDGPFTGRTALLSPLDRLIFDRKRMLELFEFDYQLEMYKLKASRRWGYFALPVLHGDRFVAKIDATADRKAGLLRIDAVHEDPGYTPEIAAEVDVELVDLAEWLGLELSYSRGAG